MPAASPIALKSYVEAQKKAPAEASAFLFRITE
jgi:hypothetical protein